MIILVWTFDTWNPFDHKRRSFPYVLVHYFSLAGKSDILITFFFQKLAKYQNYLKDFFKHRLNQTYITSAVDLSQIILFLLAPFLAWRVNLAV